MSSVNLPSKLIAFKFSLHKPSHHAFQPLSPLHGLLPLITVPVQQVLQGVGKVPFLEVLRVVASCNLVGVFPSTVVQSLV
jgi:hypothetical protein